MRTYDNAIEAARWAAEAVGAGHLRPDFMVHFGDTVWTITAENDVAQIFARERFPVETGHGKAENFTTDVSLARQLCRQLADEGFVVGCKQPGREGLTVLKC